MTEVKSSTEHMACYYIPVVTTDVHDVESQVMQVQEPKVPTAMTAADVGDSDDDDSAGKGLGIALFCHILVGFVASFFLPGITILCQITAILIASILQCGCSCAGNFNLKPHVKKRALITLVILCIMIYLQIALIGAEITIEEGKLVPSYDPGKDEEIRLYASIVYYGLGVLALIFSSLFTWGRGYGAPLASG